ncbi:unnamed protein product [Durusdinium trenchii]|uniref:Uncharacterized protein n=3 Tax=Durusdinium trenchii TaxID=1381693 RepID=A0ABP0NTQ3_9DINO
MMINHFLAFASCLLAEGVPADQLDAPHHWVPAEQCTFVNPPVVAYYWDPKCKNPRTSLGCWADGVHAECRFCGEEPYTGVRCPRESIVPSTKACSFDDPPIVPFYWEPRCKKGMLGCLADGKHLGCRFCGEGSYKEIECPSSTCSFVNEPVTPYYWDPLCRMGMLGCNADAIHVQCRFCDQTPFHSVRCPESARPHYPNGKCWFPQGTAQNYKWDKTCKWGKVGCWADGVNAQCRYCGPGSGGVYKEIDCEESVFP